MTFSLSFTTSRHCRGWENTDRVKMERTNPNESLPFAYDNVKM